MPRIALHVTRIVRIRPLNATKGLYRIGERDSADGKASHELELLLLELLEVDLVGLELLVDLLDQLEQLLGGELAFLGDLDLLRLGIGPLEPAFALGRLGGLLGAVALEFAEAGPSRGHG